MVKIPSKYFRVLKNSDFFKKTNEQIYTKSQANKLH